ncbi:MAG: AzlC family ABC transporter permease [Halobacteriota archaeon]
MNRQESFVHGARDVAPALVGNVPFGVIVGVTAVKTGFDPVAAVAMSGLMFAGAAQLAMMELLRDAAPLAIVVLTGLVVNLRYVMYSATFSQYLTDYGPRWRGAIAALLIDITFAMSVTKVEEEPAIDTAGYYMGVGIPLWATWVSATAAGAILGAGVPASWQLEFAVPLVFLALLAPAVKDSSTAVAGGVGGGVAIALTGIPFNAGLLGGALAGVVAGAVAGRWLH